jgi:hypothetical protein
MAEKLNIFDVIRKISEGDAKYFETLDPQQLNTIHHIVLQRWLTGTSNGVQIQLINMIVNKVAFTVDRMTGLLMLMACVINPPSTRYTWIPATQKKAGSMSVKVVQEAQGCSQREAIEMLSLYSLDELIEDATDLGWDDDEIKKLKKEHGSK